MCEASRVCISSSPCRCGAVVPGVLACVHAYIHMRVYVDVYAHICAGVHVCVSMHMRVRPCARTCTRVCMRMHVHTYAQMEGPGDGASACQRCLGRAYAPMCMYMHVHAYMHGRVCARPAESVTCTLEKVFWALVHERVRMLHRCVCTPTYTSVTHCRLCTCVCMYIYMCVYGCVCLWMRVCVYDIA